MLRHTICIVAERNDAYHADQNRYKTHPNTIMLLQVLVEARAYLSVHFKRYYDSCPVCKVIRLKEVPFVAGCADREAIWVVNFKGPSQGEIPDLAEPYLDLCIVTR